MIRTAMEAGKSQNSEHSPQPTSELPSGGSATMTHKAAASHARTHSSSTANSSNVNGHRASDSWNSRTPTSQVRRTPRLEDSPSSRTGPPRSFSYNLTRSTASALSTPRQNTLDSAVRRMVGEDGGNTSSAGIGLGLRGSGVISEVANEDADTNGKDEQYMGDIEEDTRPRFSHARSDFRGALEYSSPEQREKEREAKERRERHRLSRIDDNWLNPLKWLNTTDDTNQESPKDDDEEGRTGYFDFLKPSEGKGKEKESGDEEEANEKQDAEGNHQDRKPETPNGDAKQRAMSHDTGGESSSRSGKLQFKGPGTMSRAQSMPHIKRSNSRKANSTIGNSAKTAPRWNRLRSLLPVLAQQGRQESVPGQSAVQQTVVNITDELITGNLSALMLKLWFERDEKDHRRVPVLLHRLRVRISDSLHPLGGNKAVFRIECEYANGAARWVVYRQLRDFISLHRSYRLSNAYNRNVDALPEFPWSSQSIFSDYFSCISCDVH